MERDFHHKQTLAYLPVEHVLHEELGEKPAPDCRKTDPWHRWYFEKPTFLGYSLHSKEGYQSGLAL